jgi:uncharacterized membrane protein
VVHLAQPSEETIVSVLDQFRNAEQRVAERLRELKPLVEEYQELEQVARRLGLNVNEDATAQDGQRPASAANAQGHQPDAKIKARSAASTREESGGAAPAKRSAATKQRRAARASRRSGNGGRPGSNRASRREEDVLRLVEERPGITVREIAKEIGVDPTGLYRPVHKLEQEGAISKQGAGLQPVGADEVS